MSDIEDYLSENESSSDISSDYEETPIKKPVTTSIKKTEFNNNFDEEDDDEGSEKVDDDDDELNINLDEEDEIVDDEDDDIEDEDDQDDYYDEAEDTKGGAKKQVSTASTNVPKKKISTSMLINDDDDDDDIDDNYLQKFDQEINRNYVKENHPERIIHNDDEVKTLSEIVRDANNIIIDPFHKTVPFLTKYEKARILGQRAKQIESGAKPFIKVPENIIDGYVIAELELQQKKIPFVIRRPLPNGGCEYWNLRDLEIISF